MKKGVVILREAAATAELRAHVMEILQSAGWSCEVRQRFDGVQAVAFEATAEAGDADAESIEAMLRVDALLASVTLEVKTIEG